MSKLKIFLLIGLFLLVSALAASGYVWFKLQQTLSGATSGLLESVTGNVDAEKEVEAFVPSAETPIANSLPKEGLKIDSSAITDEQKVMAEKVGIDLDGVAITPEMVGCAEKKLGEGRLQEIMDGASPSVLESMSLLGCL